MSTTPEESNDDAAWEKLIDESKSAAEMFDKAEVLGLVERGELGEIRAVRPDK